MHIRKFKKSDAEKVSDLIIKNLIGVNSKDYPEEAIKHMCSTYQPEGLIKFSKFRDIFVAEEKSKIIGTVTVDKNRVYTMFIEPDSHGR